MLLKIPISEDFNLKKILKFKPFFFFSSSEPVRTIVLKGEEILLQFSQEENALLIEIDKEISQKDANFLNKRISYCFGVHENFTDFYAICEHDKILSKYMDKIYGNRLLSAFDDFEALVSIICSQNVTFCQYKNMVQNIINAYGPGRYFPIALEILKKPNMLKDCGVGYRDKYILEIAKYMRFRKSADLETLHQIKGIGPYSLDIFRLFQQRNYSVFYVDVLIKRIFREDYEAILKTDTEVRSFARKKFKNYAGLAEIYLQKFISDTL